MTNSLHASRFMTCLCRARPSRRRSSVSWCAQEQELERPFKSSYLTSNLTRNRSSFGFQLGRLRRLGNVTHFSVLSVYSSSRHTSPTVTASEGVNGYSKVGSLPRSVMLRETGTFQQLPRICWFEECSSLLG